MYNIKTSKKFLKFGDISIKKPTFHCYKYPIDIVKVVIKKIVISNKFSCDEEAFKYCTGMKCGKKQTIMYRTSSNEWSCKNFWQN